MKTITYNVQTQPDTYGLQTTVTVSVTGEDNSTAQEMRIENVLDQVMHSLMADYHASQIGLSKV